nr:b3 domain-containing protein [Quercus suber]
MPIEFENIIIKAKKGFDIKLAIQKEQSPSDMKDQFARLSIPKGQMSADFLSQEEQPILQQKEEDGVHYKGMEVLLIQPSLEECTISLKKWKNGSSTCYMLSSPWNKVATNNDLKVGDIIQIWTLRVNHGPRLALIKL